MPRPTSTDKYIGIEIECYSLITRAELRRKLNEKVQGKFDIVNEYLRAEPILPVKGDLMIENGPTKLITAKYNPTGNYYVSSYNLKEVIGKQGLFYDKHVREYFREKRFNGTRWVLNGVKLPSSKNYLEGKTTHNVHDYYYYKTKKNYFVKGKRPETHEIRLLCTQKEANSVIKKVYDVINENNVQVNKSCGLHVHLDMRPSTGRDKSIAYKNLYMCQDLMLKVHHARKNNRWCTKNTRNTFYRQQAENQRYKVINTASFSKHKTLEIRLGEATTDGAKVIAWVRMLCNIVDKKSELREQVNTTAKYLKKFKLSDTNAKIVRSMQRKPKSTSIAA